MSHYARPNRVLAEVTTATAVTGLADIGTWTVTNPVTVARVGALVTVAQTGAAPVISFDLRPTYGSDTGRQAGKVGVCTFPAGGVTVGKTVTVEVRSKINAGQQIVAAVTTVGGAGTVIPIIEWVARTENSANQGSVQLGGATQPSPLALLAERSMLDGADESLPIELGGAARVAVRPAKDTDQLDFAPRVSGEPGFALSIRVGPDPETGPGPRPFPHQRQSESAPEQQERQKPWDEAQRREDEQKDREAQQRAQQQERVRRAQETPQERRTREQREQLQQQQASAGQPGQSRVASPGGPGTTIRVR
jgi:hypothetical protein